MMMRVLRTALFLEIGLALLVVPWSAYWDRNYFAELVPPLRFLITNNFVRGAISGLGVLNIAAAVGEIGSMVLGRLSRHTPVSPSQAAKE